ncbi:MAG TPA: DHH family phosphoesterase [Mariprofundaceae bacterium]|nr:DHH family phosphoesterase [Mariprofundaceae bacterium]
MAYFDVFNGDADGICALHQLRLATPREATLVTGVKRDIALLGRVPAGKGDVVTVLDISMDKNRDDLLILLAEGAQVEYFDHHFAGDIPDDARLVAHIDTRAEVCTSLLVNDCLQGRFLPWAVTAAFGDNLHASACAAARPLGLDDEQLAQLCYLGELINYNGYGVTLDDLHMHPADLYRAVEPYADPFAFIAGAEAYRLLDAGFQSDMAEARKLGPEVEEAAIAVHIQPDTAWSRRVSGVFANELARAAPNRAHALLTALPGGGYRVSVRAPLNDPAGADQLCMKFPSGGGRKAAAGINELPASRLDDFIAAFRQQFRG